MIRVLVCDDDEYVARKLSGLLDEINSAHHSDFLVDIKSGSDFMKGCEDVYDIAVVDIEMPGVNGLELAQRLRKVNPDIILIMITSYTDYLDSAMRISVFRFLSKPVDKERFIRNFLEAVEAFKRISKNLVIYTPEGVFVVKTKDILYIENLRYGSLMVTKSQSIKTNRKLSEWYELIAQPLSFVYSHNSYIINFQNVVNFDQHIATFETEDGLLKVPCVAQRRYSELKKDFFTFAGGL